MTDTQTEIPDTGLYHGEMNKRVRNPFRTPYMRKNFDAAISVYDEKGTSLISKHGTRCRGNSWALNFWQGFDRTGRDYTGLKDSAAYAMYRAGESIRIAIEQQAIYDALEQQTQGDIAP